MLTVTGGTSFKALPASIASLSRSAATLASLTARTPAESGVGIQITYDELDDMFVAADRIIRTHGIDSAKMRVTSPSCSS